MLWNLVNLTFAANAVSLLESRFNLVLRAFLGVMWPSRGSDLVLGVRLFLSSSRLSGLKRLTFETLRMGLEEWAHRAEPLMCNICSLLALKF